jgi:hypothetical protein
MSLLDGGACADTRAARDFIAPIIVARYDNSMAKKRARGRPSSGSALSAAERMRRMRERRKAAELKPIARVSNESEAPPTYSSHRLLEARSLAMHAVIARKIERDPELLEVARRNIERWSTQRSSDRLPWLSEWRELLNQPWQTVAALITEPSENAARLRQSSPFAGILTNQERWRIYEAFRTSAHQPGGVQSYRARLQQSRSITITSSARERRRRP